MQNGLHGTAGAEAELKQQGVIEASRDPQSNVTSEDVQRVAEQESKKAGAAAFSFDPSASSATKAKQAKAVSCVYILLTNKTSH